MKRRDFVATTLAATSLLGLKSALFAADETNPEKIMESEFYELRIYTLSADAEPTMLHDFLHGAAIPAWNRLGSQPIGVFSPRDAGATPLLYVLIPHASLRSVSERNRQLSADAEYLRAGADYLALPATHPAYVRYESSLSRAFDGMPRLVLPPFSIAKTARLFELRSYESHNETAAQTKIAMFNNGEIDIMQRVGLGPVFYGEVLAGTRLPRLTYLLSAEDNASHRQHWGAFGKDAAWKKLSAIPENADARIVSKINSTFLVPTDYSQI